VIKAIVLVPIRDNAGRQFRKAEWSALERRLIGLGGFSILPGHVVGAWEDAGIVYRDRSRQYLVLLQSWFDLSAWLQAIMWARTAFRQEALLIDVAGIPEVVGHATVTRASAPSADD
jgi:hypothetical protein